MIHGQSDLRDSRMRWVFGSPSRSDGRVSHVHCTSHNTSLLTVVLIPVFQPLVDPFVGAPDLLIEIRDTRAARHDEEGVVHGRCAA
jgi:hypothetical protein